MRRAGDAADADPGCLEVFGEGIVVAVAVILAILLVVFVLLPLLVALIDLLFLLVLALIGLLGRMILGHPWLVEARCDDGQVLTWRVKGWSASLDTIASVESMLLDGSLQPDTDCRRHR